MSAKFKRRMPRKTWLEIPGKLKKNSSKSLLRRARPEFKEKTYFVEKLIPCQWFLGRMELQGGATRGPRLSANSNNTPNTGGGGRLRSAARPWDPITVHTSLQIEIIAGEKCLLK